MKITYGITEIEGLQYNVARCENCNTVLLIPQEIASRRKDEKRGLLDFFASVVKCCSEPTYCWNDVVVYSEPKFCPTCKQEIKED